MTSKPTLLVTGGGGFVAGSVIAQGAAAWDVHALTRKESLPSREGVAWHRVDVLDDGALCEAFERIRPSAVIHTAAIADIDFCENHPGTARRVNVALTRSLLDLCAGSGTKMIFLSTDNVFDGERGLYTEEDEPKPVNFYGGTKVEAERLVAAAGGHVIGRVCLVMGLPMIGEGNSFLAKMIPELKAGRRVTVPGEEVRTPVDVVTLGAALLELAGGEHTGIFHLAGNDRMNRFEMAQRIARHLGHSTDLIASAEPKAIPGRAPRPRDVSLKNAKAHGLLKTPMVGLEAGLDLVLASSGS